MLRSSTQGASLERPIVPSLGMVGIWRMTKHLHAGTWCDVYAAQPVDALGSPRSDYAVKITRLPAHDDPEAAFQMRIEASVAEGTHHRNLIPVLDGQLSAARPYIVMPLVAGVPLSSIPVGGQQPIPVVLWWARQCAQALAALHAAGWCHGDFKPENVLVDDRGHITVVDLGFAKRIGAILERQGTSTYRGTPNYTAPELLAERASVMTSATDVFSLGRMMTELLGDRLRWISAVRELAEAATSLAPDQRPSTAELVERLLKLEIDTLHLHIRPDDDIFQRDAA